MSKDWLVEVIRKGLPKGFRKSNRKNEIAQAIREEYVKRLPKEKIKVYISKGGATLKKATAIESAKRESFNQCLKEIKARLLPTKEGE